MYFYMRNSIKLARNWNSKLSDLRSKRLAIEGKANCNCRQKYSISRQCCYHTSADFTSKPRVDYVAPCEFTHLKLACFKCSGSWFACTRKITSVRRVKVLMKHRLCLVKITSDCNLFACVQRELFVEYMKVTLPVFRGKLHASQVNCVWGLSTGISLHAENFPFSPSSAGV